MYSGAIEFCNKSIIITGTYQCGAAKAYGIADQVIAYFTGNVYIACCVGADGPSNIRQAIRSATLAKAITECPCLRKCRDREQLGGNDHKTKNKRTVG